MERVKPSRKALFVFVWGVLLWGGSTALVLTLLDWHRTRHFDPLYKIVGRFAIFMAGGIIMGHYLWYILQTLGRKKPTRTQSIVRLVLFVGLMLGLIYVLWITSCR